MMIWPPPEDDDLPGNRRLDAWTTADDGDRHSADVRRDRHAAARAEPSARHGIQISPEEARAFARIVQGLTADEPVSARPEIARRIAALAATGLVWMLLSVLMVSLGWAGVLVTVALIAGTAIVVALHLRHRAGGSHPRTPSR